MQEQFLPENNGRIQRLAIQHAPVQTREPFLTSFQQLYLFIYLFTYLFLERKPRTGLHCIILTSTR